MFKEFLVKNQLSELLTLSSFHPFPTLTERAEWEAVNPERRIAGIEDAERYLHFAWPTLSAVTYMEYVRSGNRSVYTEPSFTRRRALAALVLGECFEGKGRFLDDIINGIWCICEESFWGTSAHTYKTKWTINGKPLLPDVEEHYIDLFAAETAGLLSFTVYLLQSRLDEISPLICRRIHHEMKVRIIEPFFMHEDYFWMGYQGKVNNWNPWILSNLTTVFLLCQEEEPIRIKGLTKVLTCLDFFLDGYAPDGGCDEGSHYWLVAGGALFDALDQFYRASDGKISFFQEDIIKEIGRFIYRSHIAGDYFINFADGAARINLAGDMVYRYGKYIDDVNMMSLGAFIPSELGDYHNLYQAPFTPRKDLVPQALRRELPAIFNYDELHQYKRPLTYAKDVWLQSIQLMIARESEQSTDGLYLAAKGGNNNESHNHNDVGSCIIYKDGVPAIIDVGVENYTAKTFSDKRYEIWTMQSGYHNLPILNGYMQQNGPARKAEQVSYHAEADNVQFSLDISGTYPNEAGICSYKRSYLFCHGTEGSIRITDSYAFTKDNNHLTLCFMSPVFPKVLQDGLIHLDLNEDTSLTLTYDPSFETFIDTCDSSDKKLSSIWGNHVYRIRLEKEITEKEGFVLLFIQ